jgi:hypothetical protein
MCNNKINFLKHIDGEVIHSKDGKAKLHFTVKPYHK